MWQRKFSGTKFPLPQKDVIVVILNADDSSPLWVDDLNLRRQTVSTQEVVTEKTIYGLNSLGLKYEIFDVDDFQHRTGEFDAILIPYYENKFKELCLANSDKPVYVVHCEPERDDLPQAGILNSKKEVVYAYLEKKGYEYPYVGKFQTLDMQDANVKPLLWKQGSPSEAVSWKYGNVTWTAFPSNYISYCYVLDHMVRDLGLLVSPFVFVLDIDDINDSLDIQATEIVKIAKILRENNWHTHLGIKPEKMRFLEPEFLELAGTDLALDAELVAEERQVNAILENQDVFLPLLHAHGGTKWLAPTEQEQSDAYLGLLEKLQKYGFRIDKDSYGYMYCPCNEFNSTAVSYMKKIGVHAMRVCSDTYPNYDNRYYQLGSLSLIPSDCPMGAGIRSISETHKHPIEYYALIRWYMLDDIFNKRITFLHGENFSDGILGFKALSNMSSLVDDTGIAIMGSPFDLRDKYDRPYKILSQKEGRNKIILTFDRVLTGEKLVSPSRSIQRVVNERGEDLVLFSSYIICGAGKILELYYNLASMPTVPGLKTVSNNAFLKTAVCKDGIVTLALEGYGDTDIALVNMGESTRYKLSDPGQVPTDQEGPTLLTSSSNGELRVKTKISSYKTLTLSPAK